MKKLVILALLFIPIIARGDVFIDAPSVVLVENNFYLYVNVENVEMFNSADYSIFYNSSIFAVEAVENGNINGSEINCNYSIKDGECKIVSDASLNPLNGSGYLSKIKFRCIASGLSYISIEGNMSDFYGNEINVSWNGKNIVATPTCLKIDAPDIASGYFYAFINISNVSFLNATNFELIFDKYFIEFIEIENGSIGGDEVCIYFNEFADGIKIVALTNASGSGCIAKIKFRVKNLGSTNINISNATLSGFYEEISPYIMNKTILISSRPPVANDDYYTTNEDIMLVAIAPGVLENDYDADGDTLSAILVSEPSHGSLSFNSNGSFIYAPQPNYYGQDSFTYKAYDGQADSNIATVYINITAVNDAPFAVDDTASTSEDTPVLINLTSNDYDIDGSIDLTSISITQNPSHGSLNVYSNGTIKYTPDEDYYGSDSFKYKVKDNDGAESNEAWVNITINLVNHPPNKPSLVSPANNSADVSINQTLTVHVVDVDGNSMSVKFYGRKLGNSTWQLLGINTGVGNNTDTSITWYNLEYGTTYEWYAGANDSITENSSDIWRFTTQSFPTVNHAPVANDDYYSTNEDIMLVVNAPGVLGNDTDADEDTLSAILVSEPSHGSLIFNSNGSFTYIPKSNYYGSDSFTYKAYDGQAYSNIAKVYITINPANDPPQKPASPNPANGATNVGINAVLSWQCIDVDGDAFYDVYFGTSSNPPKVATVTTKSYNPELSYETTYYWRVVAKDGQYENSSDTWSFTTMSYIPPPPPPANQPPTCSLNANISQGYAPLHVNFIMNASDDGSIASWELDVDNDGIAEYNGSGPPPSTKQHVYTTPGNYTARLIVRDDKGASDDTEITIRVLQNHKPVVTIVNPFSGIKISENILIEGFASDEDGNDTIQRVEIKIDGGQWQPAEGKNSWRYLLNISGIGEGEHIIYARSYDGIDYSEEKYIGITVEKIREEKKSIYPYIFILVAIVIAIIFVIRKYRKVI
ncbi:MAG: tandem-95 repeat protein [Thermoplasmatales archaeon]|nr:tandem-95 repeat protein [Thermoplasmatales archaeon]